ncbi:MAG TPA: sugar ABC transporter substrate-binding protein [Nocardioidaceae bacterium]|nr:sugar ABC transporter substrate-binding protein [Nocardioidaceae bacterium]
MRRPVRTAAVLAVAALALAACGRSADTGGSGQAQGSEPIAEGPATGTIDVWAMGTEGEALGDFAKAFQEENPKATVNVTPVPWEAAHNKLASAIAAGKTPDVSLIGTTWMGEFAAAGGLAPTPQGLVEPTSFFQGAWESSVVDGTSYGVPWYVDTRALFYRTDLAQQAGWDAPPESWEELQQFAADLQTKAGVEHGIYLQPGQTGSWQTVLPFAWSNGAELFDGEQYTIDTEPAAEALEYYKSFYDKGLSPTRMLEPGALEQGFVDGTYGSFINGPWYTGLIEDIGGQAIADKYAVAPVPAPDGGMGTSFVGGGNMAVFDTADNKEAAWKFVAWLAQPDVQQQWYETVGGLPSVKAAWESGALAKDPRLKVFGDQLTKTVAPPTVPTWEQVAAVLDSDIEKAVRGAAPVGEALSHTQQRAQSIGTGF